MTAIFSFDTWARIYPFLERAQDVPSDELEEWLAQITTEHPEIAAPLRDVLLLHRDVETGAFLPGRFRIPIDYSSRIGQRVGAYIIESLLGKGGMGEVWLARRNDGRFQGLFAVKFLDLTSHAASALDRFRREGRMLARLTHPNIARLIDAGATDDGQPYLVLEYIKGEAIDQFCDAHSLGLEGRVRLFLDVVAAVAHAQTNLIVHRDIKPSNVLVTPDSAVKLLDFGIAKLLGSELAPEDQSQATRIEDVALTPDYAAPEQILGEPPSTATDVYQLGVLLHLLLVGRLPSSGSSQSRADRVRAALEEISVRPSELAEGATSKALRGDLDAIIGKALRKRPDERYTTASALAIDLRRYLDHEPVNARDGAFAYRAKKFIRRYRRSVIGTSVAILALVIATTFALVQMREAQAQRDQARFLERRSDAENQFLTQVMSTIGSDGRPVTPAQILDKGVKMLDTQYSNDPGFRVDLLIRMAMSFLNVSDEEKAYSALLKAEAIARPLNNPLWIAEIECIAVEPELNAGHVEKAAQRLAEGTTALGRIAHPSVVDRVQCMDGNVMLTAARGNIPAAIELAKQTLVLMEGGGETRNYLYTQMLGRIMILYSEAGDATMGYEYAKRQVDALEANGWGESQSGVDGHLNLAAAQAELGEYKAAFVEESAVVARLRGGTNNGLIEAPISLNYGVMQLRLNQVPAALKSLDDSIAASQRDGDLSAEVYARGARARALIAGGQLDQAEFEIRKVKELTKGKEDTNRNTLRSTAVTEASLLRLRGKLAAAKHLIDATIEDMTVDKSGPAIYLGSALLESCRIAIADHRFADAERAAVQAVAVAEKRSRKPELSADVGEALLLQAQTALGEGHEDQARQIAQKSAAALGSSLGVDHPLTLAAAALH